MDNYQILPELKAEIEDCSVECGSFHGIRKTDEYLGLECFCSDNPPNDDFERKIRGHVFHNNKLIFKSMPYAVTYDENIKLDVNDFNITLMKEGTAIRVFFYQNKWFITTHRKLNAFKSKWGKVSFGEIFEKNILLKTKQTLDDFCKTLNKEYSYVFLVGTTDITRSVSPAYDDVILLYTTNQQGQNIIDNNFETWYLPTLHFSNIQEVSKYVQEMKFPFLEGIGLFLTSKTEDLNYKIYNTEYLKLASLRNNLPSIMFAYLHNVFDLEKKEMFRKLYSKFQDDFNMYDKELILIAKDIQQKYFRRFVKKEVFTVSKHEHNILYHVHKIFLENRVPITTRHVIQAFQMDGVKITDINKIISERKYNRKVLSEKPSEE